MLVYGQGRAGPFTWRRRGILRPPWRSHCSSSSGRPSTLPSSCSASPLTPPRTHSAATYSVSFEIFIFSQRFIHRAMMWGRNRKDQRACVITDGPTICLQGNSKWCRLPSTWAQPGRMFEQQPVHHRMLLYISPCILILQPHRCLKPMCMHAQARRHPNFLDWKNYFISSDYWKNASSSSKKVRIFVIHEWSGNWTIYRVGSFTFWERTGRGVGSKIRN